MNRWRRAAWGLGGLCLLGAALSCGSLGRCYQRGRALPLPEREIRDVTQLVRFVPDRVARPHSTEEVQALLRQHDGPVSIGGGRFSQGGQIGLDGTLFLDLRELDDLLELDVEGRRLRVEAGATWRHIQEALDPHDLSLQIMQSYANFTVGGSLSVNAHGRYVGKGPLVQSVRSFVLVTADGASLRASREENPEVFFGAAGGYGGLGVITEVELELAPNERLVREVERLPLSALRPWFDEHVRGSPSAVLFNADLYPPSFEEVATITFRRTEKPVTVPERLQPVGGSTSLDRLVYWWVSEAPMGKQTRSELIDRLRLQSSPVVWRNYEASYDARGLEPGSREESTYVLQEYFLPPDHLEPFAAEMTEIFTRYGVNVINVSIRHVEPDPDTLLSWAPEERFAFVVYYKQETGQAAQAEVALWTRELVEAALQEGGSYYLPYQIHASSAQLHRAYPRAQEWFALKMQLDPRYRLRNALWDRYLPPQAALQRAEGERATREALARREGWLRPEDQALLALPERYIAHSGDELDAWLSGGGAPGDFPFFESVCQLCELYGAVSRATERYPRDTRHHARIWVMGASYAAEYATRGAWEGTLGRLFERAGGSVGEASPRAQSDETEVILAWARPRGARVDDIPGVLAVEALGEGEVLLSLRRHEPFTAAVQELSRRGVELVEVAGGERVVVQVRVDADWDGSLWGDEVFSWPILTEPGRKRVALEVPVRHLDEILPVLGPIEHVYD
jgi:FAD/FMN-containing dehydrogenase